MYTLSHCTLQDSVLIAHVMSLCVAGRCSGCRLRITPLYDSAWCSSCARYPTVCCRKVLWWKATHYHAMYVAGVLVAHVTPLCVAGRFSGGRLYIIPLCMWQVLWLHTLSHCVARRRFGGRPHILPLRMLQVIWLHTLPHFVLQDGFLVVGYIIPLGMLHVLWLHTLPQCVAGRRFGGRPHMIPTCMLQMFWLHTLPHCVLQDGVLVIGFT